MHGILYDKPRSQRILYTQNYEFTTSLQPSRSHKFTLIFNTLTQTQNASTPVSDKMMREDVVRRSVDFLHCVHTTVTKNVTHSVSRPSRRRIERQLQAKDLALHVSPDLTHLHRCTGEGKPLQLRQRNLKRGAGRNAANAVTHQPQLCPQARGFSRLQLSRSVEIQGHLKCSRVVRPQREGETLLERSAPSYGGPACEAQARVTASYRQRPKLLHTGSQRMPVLNPEPRTHHCVLYDF